MNHSGPVGAQHLVSGAAHALKRASTRCWQAGGRLSPLAKVPHGHEASRRRVECGIGRAEGRQCSACLGGRQVDQGTRRIRPCREVGAGNIRSADVAGWRPSRTCEIVRHPPATRRSRPPCPANSAESTFVWAIIRSPDTSKGDPAEPEGPGNPVRPAPLGRPWSAPLSVHPLLRCST